MNMRAISPVIATVIIVSVAIAIAVAVAFWMTGITGIFTRYEKLEIISAYAEKEPSGAPTGYFRVTLRIRNTGSSDATIDNVFVNGVPVESSTTGSMYVSQSANGSTAVNFGSSDQWISVNTGSSTTLYVFLDTDNYSSGQIVEIKVHTASGNEYPKSVQLP